MLSTSKHQDKRRKVFFFFFVNSENKIRTQQSEVTLSSYTKCTHTQLVSHNNATMRGEEIKVISRSLTTLKLTGSLENPRTL